MMEYLQPYTVSFFGHREIDHFIKAEEQIERIIRKLLNEHPYVEFLVGRDGEYDQIVSSAIRRIKAFCGAECICHTLVLPYPKAEYINNIKSFEEYYDEIEICEASAAAHPKAAIQIRNREMVDRSDLVVCCIEHNSGGAYQTVRYAKKQGKQVINAMDFENETEFE